MSTSQKKKQNKSGGFQSMGLSYSVLKGVLRKGYKVPTPIQRKTIPVIVEGRDVVAMARTGSGKTAAFLLPLFEKLKCRSAQSGARALILSPTRELALQTLKFTKELGKFCNFKATVILGGNKIEDQFASIHENPDIIIATPGRFLHVVVEMDLKLSSVEYVVFDEADRLFEMGFQEQLVEIINRLPESRQTLLFSATLPGLLVDFAKAGLHDPVLIRLDVETQLSDQLQTSYFSCRSEDKPAVLLHLMKSLIKPTEMTVVFAATKHHVEYLKELLSAADVPCSYVYSSLDQAARKINVAKFQARKAKVLLVTDVAARGIDIPLLDNVINYNFSAKPKLFVHRVGRVARAGRSGSAYSLVSPDEAPFLLDLHLFLGRPIKYAKKDNKETDGVYGSVPQSIIDEENDLLTAWHNTNHDLKNMAKVCKNAYKQYLKSRPVPSPESVKRMKDVVDTTLAIHPVFNDEQSELEMQRLKLLEGMHKFRPESTIFEIGRRAKSNVTEVMLAKRRRDGKFIAKTRKRRAETDEEKQSSNPGDDPNANKIDDANEQDIKNTFSLIVGQTGTEKKMNTERKKKKLGPDSFRDKEYYLPRYAPGFHSEKGLGLDKSFDHQAMGAVLDFVGDESNQMNRNRAVRKWDRKKKKFVGESGVDPKKKKIKTESGVWIPASYKSNLYHQWKNKNQIDKQDDDDKDEGSMFGAQRPGLQRKAKQKRGKQKSRRPPKRELKTKEEILKERTRKAKLHSHAKRKHAERTKKKGLKKK